MSTSRRCPPDTSRCTTSPGTARPGRWTRVAPRTRPGNGPSGFPAPKMLRRIPVGPRRPATIRASSARGTSTATAASTATAGTATAASTGSPASTAAGTGTASPVRTPSLAATRVAERPGWRVRGGVRRRRRQVRPRLRRGGRQRAGAGTVRPPFRPGPPRSQEQRRRAGRPPQAQVPLDRAAGRVAGHRGPAGGGRRLRLRPLPEQVPPGRLLRRRHRLGRGPGHLGRFADQPRAQAGEARRRGQFPCVRPGGRAQHEFVRATARLLRDAQAHEGVPGLRDPDQPEEHGPDKGHDPGGLAAEPDRVLPGRQIRHPAQRVRQGAQGPGAAAPARLCQRKARGVPVPRDL